MSEGARHLFWKTTLRLTAALLVAWLLVNLLVPWFARDLHELQGFGFPLGYWLAAEGALLLYLLIIVCYVGVMDRLEASYLDRMAEEAARSASDSAEAGPP